MLSIPNVRSRLQTKEVGLGIITASGVVLAAAVLFSLWGLSRGSDSEPQAGSIVFEVSVPQEISLTEGTTAYTEDGTPLATSGSTASLAFREGYLDAIDLPILYSSSQLLASFSDPGAGIYLEQTSTGQQTLRFPLLSDQQSMPLIVTATVESIQPQDRSSSTRLQLGRLQAEAKISITQASADGIPSVEEIRLVFELHRLPEDARLTVSQINELNVSTRSSIDSALDESKGPWTTALAISAIRTNLNNGDDVGEASLYVTLPNLDQTSLESLMTAHVDDGGQVELLDPELVSTTGGEAAVRFLSPSGLSIFAIMVPSGGLQAIAIATATSEASPSPVPSSTGAAIPAPTPTKEVTPTALPRPTPTSSPTAVSTVTMTPAATTTSVSPATPTMSPSPTMTATRFPTAIPTPTSSPTPTYTPPPQPTPQPTRTTRPPASTPISRPDEPYAAIVHSNDPATQQWILDTLGTNWFLDWTSNVDVIPNGHEKLIPILSLPGPSTQRIQDIADLAPGSVWYVVGEPNRRAGYGAGDIVTQLHDLYEEIKAADPTAKITSPSILNWEFTCIGCAGYQKGSLWLDEFRAAYLSQYGEEPPIDIWAIDVYPIDWWNLPTVDHQLAIDQVDGMRQYLDAVGQQDTPIWITELGLHWGWDYMIFEGDEGYDSSCGGAAQPAGTYQTQSVIDYLDAIFDWLDANAVSKKIEKWFLFSTYRNITTCNSDSYAGLTLFDGPEMGANLTLVGEFFRDRVLGISPVVNDVVNGVPLLVTFDDSSATGVVFSPMVDGRRLNFRQLQAPDKFLMEDMETRTVWDPLAGTALEGPLAGTRLEQMASHYEFWFAWKDYRPETELYQG